VVGKCGKTRGKKGKQKRKASPTSKNRLKGTSSAEVKKLRSRRPERKNHTSGEKRRFEAKPSRLIKLQQQEGETIRCMGENRVDGAPYTSKGLLSRPKKNEHRKKASRGDRSARLHSGRRTGQGGKVRWMLSTVEGKKLLPCQGRRSPGDQNRENEVSDRIQRGKRAD